MALRPLRSFGTGKIFVGPMTSGKSEAMIRDILKREKYGLQRGVVYRPTASKRDDHDRHTSRDGASFHCTYFDTLSHLGEIIDKTANVVGIDEIHFLDDPMAFVRFIEGIQRRGQDVLLGGVDTSFLGESFAVVAAAMNLDHIQLVRLEAWCTICGFEARWSQLLGEPPQRGSIAPGYQYEARCTEHFTPRRYGA